MAFVHCHRCGWEQDDFWSKTYNPLLSLMDWEQSLLEEDLDKTGHRGVSYLDEESEPTTMREMIAQACEKAAKRIRGMEWRTDSEFRKPGASCPRCGATNLDVD